ncbi:helix-hairpin-helix domain-containing protein [Rubellicoccus peritrichatus]|uniref:Helix-hairpin-helix domain-containing protein n=1 Tax=Rubellicoccus peritrichatus TaxID=3080537 RepID=A0AAQ3QXD4_9BACT|nr:helix-hairpin-helix domain-containing protein [Puniceicoccus sp. CR14]WOO42750.1 helix-hairpin-helix domain-containing protein [Puniceicoccus sp. CR14]
MKSCHQILLLTLAALLGQAKGFEVRAGNWEVLDGCRLIDSFLNDGDSFLIEHDGEEFVVRLYFVDAPEVSMSYPERVRKQSEYFGISDEETLELGREAAEFTRDFLDGRFTVITSRQKGGGHGIRYLALVEKNGKGLAESLARSGLVRIYGYPTETRPPGGASAEKTKDSLRKYEKMAKRNQLGGWGDQTLADTKPSFFIDEPTKRPKAEEMSEKRDLSPSAFGATIGGGLDINKATADELQSISGIGPVLSARIIEGRPYDSIEALAAIKGISANSVEKFRPYLYAGALEPPEFTASYYLQQPELWRNRVVPLSIRVIEKQNWPAPDGFAVVIAHTENAGQDGGSVPVFLPEDRVDAAVVRFSESEQPLTADLLFYNYQGKDIFIVRR